MTAPAFSLRRLRYLIIPCLVTGLTLLGSLSLHAQDVAAAVAEEPNETAAKYHEALVRRPSGGYLFERFFNAWLETGSVEGLEGFLTRRAGANSEEIGESLLLAYFFSKQGNDEKAISIFETALTSDPENAEAWLEKAKIEARLLNFEKAIADLDKASASEPKEEIAIEIGKLKGRLLSRAGRGEEALAAWKALASEHADDEELQEDLVELHLTEGLVDEAVALMTGLVDNTGDAYQKITRQLRLGDIYQRSGKREEAIALYGTSLAASGRDTWLEKEILAQIEHVFRREDDIAGLSDHLVKLIEAESGRIALMKRRAMVLAELQEADEAVKVFAEILKLTPGDRENRETFIDLLGRLGKHAESAEQMAALAALHPDDGELIAQLAVRQHAAGQKEAAKASVVSFLEKSDGSEYAHLRAARLLEQFKEDAAAEEVFGKLVAAYPESLAAKESQAEFLHRTGRKEEAFAIWKSLAAGGTGQDALRAARALASRGERQGAYDILLARAEEFAADFSFIDQICGEAIALEKLEEALPWAEKRLALAESSIDLNEAMRLVVSVLDRLDRIPAHVELLKSKADRTLPETCLLAELLERDGQYDAAEDLLLPELEAGSELAITQQARLFRSRDEWQKAADTQLRLVNLPGGRTSSNLQELSQLHRRAANYDEALKWIDEWKKLSPGATQPWVEQSSILMETNKAAEAIAVMRGAVQRFEDQTDLRSQLAGLHLQEGQYADAERIFWTLYEESEDISQKITWAGSLATAAANAGRLEPLLEQFEERRRGNRSSIAPILAIAEIHRRDNNYEGRREALLEATRLRPEDLKLLQEIARIEEEEGNWEAASETLRTALPLDKTASTRERIALLELRYGDEEEGFRQLLELKAVDTMDADAILKLADAMVARSDMKRAADFISTHRERFPDDYRLAYLQAVALVEDGRTAEAQSLFLDLLSWEVEIAKPAATTASARAVPAAVLEAQKKAEAQIPKGATDLIDFRNESYYALYYRQMLRQQSPRFQQYGALSGTTSLVAQPTSLSNLKGFAKAHLLDQAQDMNEAEKDALAVQMSARGMASADIIVKLPTQNVNSGGVSQIPLEMLDEYPDRQDLWAAAVVVEQHMMYNAPEQVNTELLARAYDKFLADYPEFAFACAVGAASSGTDEGVALLKKALAEVPLDDEPSSVVTAIVSAATRGKAPYTGDRASLLPDELRLTLVEKSLAWREAALARAGEKDRTAVAQSFFSYETHSWTLRSLPDLSAFADYLDEEIARYEEIRRDDPSALPTGLIAQYWPLRNLTQGRSVIAQNDFPPLHLPDFPPNVLLHFAPVQAIGYGLELPDPDQTLAQVDRVKSPVLKALLAHLAGDKERTEKEIESLLADGPASGLSKMQIHLLASAFYGSVKEDPARALALLEEIRTSAMSREMRRAIDGSIVAYAVQAAESKDAAASTDPSPALVAGREAALRLRYGLSSQNHRTELAVALETLGLEDEAEKLRDKATVATSRSSSFSPFRGQAAPGLDDRVKKLVTDGKVEEATRLTLQNLRPTLKHMASGKVGGNIDYNLLQFVRTISRDATILPALVKELDPGDRSVAKAEALFEWGAFQELLGKLTEAAEAYRAGLAVPGQGKRPGIEARTAALLCYTSPGEAGELLAGLEKNRFREVIECLQFIDRSLDYSNSDRDNRLTFTLNMGRAVTTWLESLDEADFVTLDLAPLDYAVRNKIAEQSYGGPHEFLPGLYSDMNPRSSWQLSRIQRAAGEKVEKERRQIHDDLCRTLMRSPQMARRVFSYFVGIRMGEDAEKTASDPEVEALARLALASAAKPSRLGQGQFGQSYRNFYTHCITLWSPEEYLMWLSLRKEDGPDETLMDAVRATKQRDAIVAAGRFHDIAFCAPDEFPAKAAAYLRGGVGSISQIQTGSRPSADEESLAIPAKLFAVWEARREHLGDFDLIDFWRDDLKSGPVTSAFLPVLLYEKTFREEGHEAALPILDAITLHFLDEREKWSDFRKDGNQGNEDFSRPDHILYASLMQRLCNRLDTALPVAAYLRGEGLDNNGQVTGNTLLIGLSSPRLAEDPEMTMALLDKSPFLGAIESFHSIETQRGNLLRDCLEEIRKNGPAKVRIRDFAGKKGTFGGDLVAAYLADNQKTAVAGVLGKYRKQVEASLTGEKAGDLGAFVNRLYDGGGADYDLLTEDARAVFDLLGTERAKTAREAVDEFLARKDFGDLNIQSDSDLEKHLITLLGPLWSVRDWELGIKVYWHAMDLTDRQIKAGRWRSYATSGWNVEGDVLHDVMNQAPGSDLERIGMFERILASDKEGRIPITAGGMGFAGDLRSVFNQAGGEAKPEAAIEATLAALHEVCGNESPVLLSFYLMEMVFQLRPPFAPRLAAWADSKAEGEPWSPIAKEFGQTIRMAMQTSMNTAYKPLWPKVKNIESWQDHYIAVLQDDSRSLPWRVAVADEVCDANATLRPATSMVCAAILADALIADAPTNTWHAQRITMQFNKLEKTAEWEALARRLHEGWIYKNRNNNKSTTSGLAFVPGTECVLAMLEMHLRLGDAEATRKIRTEKNAFDRIKGNARSLLVLVTFGDFEGAAHVLREGVEFQDIMDDYMVAATYYQMRYSQRAHEQLPLFLETIEEPALRYFAELIVLGAIDPLPDQKEANAGYPVRGVRLVEAAKRFGEVDFAASPRGTIIRERSLQQIASMDPSSGVVGPIWEKEYRPEKCAAYCNLGDYKKIEHASRPLAAHAALRLRIGDISIVKDMIKAANESTASQYYRRESLEHFTFRLIESLKHRSPQAKPEEWAGYTEALGLLLSGVKLEIFDHSNVVPLIGAYFTAAAKSGQVGDFTVWAKALPDERAEKIAAHIRRSPLPFWGSFVQILKTRVTDPNILPTPEVREEILTSLIAHPITRRAYDLHDPFFRFAIDHNMLTVDEVRGDTGRRLEAMFPRNGYSAGEIARYHADAGDWEAALEWADKSITELTPEKLTGPYARIAMRRITILVEAKRDAEAASAMKDLEARVDFERLPADLQQTRASLLKVLKG